MCVGLIGAPCAPGAVIGWEDTVERISWALPSESFHSSGETHNIAKTGIMMSSMGMSTLKKIKQRNRL